MLADFQGQPLIMAFYPADWSPVCTDQMALYNEVLPEFTRLGARLVGISIDHAWSHIAFAKNRNLRFPLLADFHPKGDVARRYGVYDDNIGMSERALFVVDANGVIHWSYVSPIGVNPGADGILTALESMASEAAA
jgi:peroxiredoxin